jgi:hypothetical protein
MKWTIATLVVIPLGLLVMLASGTMGALPKVLGDVGAAVPPVVCMALPIVGVAVGSMALANAVRNRISRERADEDSDVTVIEPSRGVVVRDGQRGVTRR